MLDIVAGPAARPGYQTGSMRGRHVTLADEKRYVPQSAIVDKRRDSGDAFTQVCVVSLGGPPSARGFNPDTNG